GAEAPQRVRKELRVGMILVGGAVARGDRKFNACGKSAVFLRFGATRNGDGEKKRDERPAEKRHGGRAQQALFHQVRSRWNRDPRTENRDPRPSTTSAARPTRAAASRQRDIDRLRARSHRRA